MLAHRLPMISAPRIRVLDLTGMGVMWSYPCAMQDRGLVRPAAK